MPPSRHAFAVLITLAVLAAGLTGCDEDATPPQIEPPWVSAPTSPEKLMRAIEVIYNDKEHSAAERTAEYENLLSEDFIFYFDDLPEIGRASWGRADEIAAHQCLFEKQHNRDIFSLELAVTNLPATDLDPPEGPEGWQDVFATSVFLRLLTTPTDGFEVQGGQARFHCAPAADGSRWFIARWWDLPRPEVSPGRGVPVAIEPSTWGFIKTVCRP